MGTFRVATWNQDHWKRTPKQREAGWARLKELGTHVALLQECAPPADIRRDHAIWRELGGSRRWGSAVYSNVLPLEEITHARSRYARHAYDLHQACPGGVAIGRVRPPDDLPITVISVYGVMDPYVQTTLFRIVADLIPLFDSPDGRRVILGGDLNLDTATDAVERPRLRAILASIESLGLKNLFLEAKERLPRSAACPCGLGEACFHVQTHRNSNLVGTPREHHPMHLDYLFASPELAKQCTRIWLDEGDPTWELSDHRAILAEFNLVPQPNNVRTWDERTFTEELEGATAGTATNLFDWAKREGLRVAFEDGIEGQWWAQLDGEPSKLQWTFSVKTTGEIILQFQHMTEPFGNKESRERLRERLNTIPGVAIPAERLTGRPTIPLSVLATESAFAIFRATFSELVAETRRTWGARLGGR